MKTNFRSFRRSLTAVAVTLAALSTSAQAIVLLNDDLIPTRAKDFRPGKLVPSAAQLAEVRQLGANASWNRFGTVNSMIRYGGYLGGGYGTSAPAAARAFVLEHRGLFKLSEAGVRDLELINEGITPNNKGRAVLFRQRFSGLQAARDGLITIGVVDGKVYYVSSSSAGEQPPASPAILTPTQAWMTAAADVLRPVTLDRIKHIEVPSKTSAWNVLTVQGFAQPQRTRLVALPMPNGGVRQAYETIVLNVSGADVLAFVDFVDAQTGQVLIRENRVNWQAGGSNTQQFQGEQPDAMSCGPKHDVEIASQQTQATITVVAANPASDIKFNLYRKEATGTSTPLLSYDLLLGAETTTYAPPGGIPPGIYQVEVCPLSATSSVPPYNYVGTFTTQEGSSPASVSLPQWKWNPAYPLPDYSSTDIRKLGCWVGAPGCDIVVGSVASRAPWDVNINSEQSTHTTTGNNANTAEAWGSPLTPAEMYRPISADRRYIFPFTNAWNTSKCNPSNLVPGGNDIDATVTDLFVVHNRMHDWAYFLGFTERNYNLQTNNFGNTDPQVENDQETGNAQAGAISGAPGSPTFFQAPGRDNANQITLNDGVPGITNQYLFQSLAAVLYGPCADGDYDMSVVGHEYTHAISNRMIAGPDGNIASDQGGAMGESWSDLDATEYLMAHGYIPVGTESPTSIGAYATGDKEIGIRNFSLDNNPLNYTNIGYDTPGVEVHSDGEIWNAVQWTVRQGLIDKYESIYPYAGRRRQEDCANGVYAADECPGNRRWIQMVFDSFLLQQGGTSMLDARDAMLASDMARFGGANQKEMWRAFAYRGMGINAYTADGDDPTPTGNFESPLEPSSLVTFQVLAGDETGATVPNAKIFVGQFSTRSRPVADTDPATVVDATDDASLRRTSNTLDSARMIPGQYDFMVEAPGYGVHAFKGFTLAAGATTITFTLPTNWASMSKGGAITTSAGSAVNQGGKNLLIDDTEDTGVRFGDAAPVAGKYAILALGGGAHKVSNVSISTAAGPPPATIFPIDPEQPTNGGRYTGLRQFEVRVCNGACTNPDTDFTTVAYTSAVDAFPAKPLRPLQPNLTIRNFEFAPVMATHVMIKALNNQCTGQPLFGGDTDSDPLVSADCPSYNPPPTAGVGTGIVIDNTFSIPVAPASVIRAAEMQVYTSKAKSTGSTLSTPAANPTPAPAPTPSNPGTGNNAPPVGAIGDSPVATATARNEGRFGGALGLGLLLPLLFGIGRRRRLH